MSYKNNMKIQFLNKSANEGFARVAVAAFVAQLDVTVEQLADTKTAVSEAVTNSIVHGYESLTGYITLECEIDDGVVAITVSDCGRGMSDVNLARQPLYTSRPELERSGMGFTVMESFMDKLTVRSRQGKGTSVTMCKKLNNFT